MKLKIITSYIFRFEIENILVSTLYSVFTMNSQQDMIRQDDFMIIWRPKN